MGDVDRITRVGAVDGVLVHTGCAQTLIVGSADNPAGADEPLQTWNPVVDLLADPETEVQRQFPGGIGLGGWAGGVAQTGGSVAPGHHRAVRAVIGRRDDQAAGFALDTVDITGYVVDAPSPRTRDAGGNRFLAQQGARRPPGHRIRLVKSDRLFRRFSTRRILAGSLHYTRFQLRSAIKVLVLELRDGVDEVSGPRWSAHLDSPTGNTSERLRAELGLNRNGARSLRPCHG